MVRASVQRSKTGCVLVSTVEQVPHVAPVLGGRVPAITANANVSPNSQMAQRWGSVARLGKTQKTAFSQSLDRSRLELRVRNAAPSVLPEGSLKLSASQVKGRANPAPSLLLLTTPVIFRCIIPSAFPPPSGPSVFLRALGSICARADSRRSSCKIALALFAREDGESRGLVTHKSRVQGSLRRYRARGDGAGFGNRPGLPMHRALARASAADQ